jgi:hypothetical protein
MKIVMIYGEISFGGRKLSNFWIPVKCVVHVSYYITLHYYIIQLTPRWVFSVTDYINHYDFLCYLLSLDYSSLQQLRYYSSNYVYPNPPCQLALSEETGVPGENPRLSAVLTDSFHMSP